MQNMYAKQKKGEDDADMHLARNTVQNKQYKVCSQADDEYDYEDGPSRKGQKKHGGDDHKISQTNTHTNRFVTQKERCLFFLENPNRPMHLVVSIANHNTKGKASGRHRIEKKRIEKESTDIAVDSIREKEIVRKELGLEWMLRSESNKPVETIQKLPEEAPVEETKKVNPKELNPYLKDDGSGYPEDSDRAKVGADQLLSSSLVGDGGASWRLKALKHAQEQAAREGQRLGEVVEERWSSLGELTVSIASREAAPSLAHLRAIKSRKRGLTEDNSPYLDDRSGKDSKRDYLKDVSLRHGEMRAPKVRDSLSWGKQKSKAVAAEGAGIISAAASSLNKFSNNGSFMHEFLQEKDMHLARNIVQNKQYKVCCQADDEYDYEDGPSRKGRKKQGGDDHKISQTNKHTNRFVTQKECCLFCLENPDRPMHLVVSIANHTYLMLPQWQPVVPGHCCILPIQHESATRTVDDDIWIEIRNFKKCLIMMFAKQEKEVVFLETVMGLAQQRRHCMIECIPLPQDIAKEAPLYFKKAIDEAEDEWSQHNAN